MEESDEPVRIAAYDPSWPARFGAEKGLLQSAIGAWITGGIHHVGSTAVPGLAAKPVIDILAGVEDLPSSRGCIAALAQLDYLYAPYRADEMHWFCKPDPGHRTHHLHVVPTGTHRYLAELAFRDALRARPDLAAEYAELKRTLAAKHGDDREAYTDAKQGFIADALARPRWFRVVTKRSRPRMRQLPTKAETQRLAGLCESRRSGSNR